jgi:hypothetical protein
MRNIGKEAFLGIALGAALAVSGCGGPKVETPKPSLPTPTSSGTPGNTEGTHLQIGPCKTKMPWEGAVQGQKLAITKPVIVFDSMIRPQPTTKPRIQPECWDVVPNVPATANPSQTPR